MLPGMSSCESLSIFPMNQPQAASKELQAASQAAMMGAGAASLAWAAAATEEAAVLRHRTLIGTPFLKAMLSLQATCGLRTAKLWRTLSKVNRHILPGGPSQPSRVVREAKSCRRMWS